MSVAIMGAGPAGLAAAREALACGLDPTVFEKASEMGGLWKPGGGTWETMHTNLSRFSCMFSSFSWPSETDAFPSRPEVHRYLCDYAKHFQLSSKIVLETEVRHLSRKGEKWEVRWVQKGEEQTKEFDFAIVATGVFAKGYIPKLSGQERFQGTMVHSQDYTASTFKGKKVVVVGSSFSGTELAADVTKVAASVTHVFRRPCWVLSKYPTSSLPLDFVFYNRAAKARKPKIEEAVAHQRSHMWFQDLSPQGTLNPALAISPSSEPPHIAISDAYLPQIAKGTIIPKRAEIAAMYEKGLVYADGSQEEADAVLFCTGFRTQLSFMDPALLEELQFDPKDPFMPLPLHKATWPTLPNLAFLGMYRGPFFAVMELQARWATLVFSKQIALPSQETLHLGIEEACALRKKEPRPQFPYSDYMGLSDDLAKECGVFPSFDVLQKTDPILYKSVWEGPYIPAHFRLEGPGADRTLAVQMIEEAGAWLACSILSGINK